MHGIKHYDDGGAVANDTPILQSADPALLAHFNLVVNMAPQACAMPPAEVI